MKKNIIANYIGRFWGIFSNILFIPLYIHFLGIEGYSIISFSLVLAGLMIILDAGMTTTLSKEFASKSNSLSTKQKLFTSLETIYLLIACFIIILFFVFSNLIANNWLNIEHITPAKVSNYINILGIGIAFQLLSQFYWGGLIGLEQQVKANIYQIGLGVVRNGMVILPLIYWPNLYVFFIWQTSIMIIYTIIIRRSLVKSIFTHFAINDFLKFDRAVIKRVWGFAGGVLLISLVAALNSQMDRVAISKFLPLVSLGYYTLAVSLAQGLLIIISPLGTAIFPRLTALYSENRQNEATELFQNVFLISNILIFAFASNMIFNAESLLWIWTGNTKLAIESAPFIPYLAVGLAVGSLQTIPYYISLANGVTKYNNYLGLISLIITFPGYWLMTKTYGAIGAAIVMCSVRIMLTPIYLYIINKKFIHLSPLKEFIKKVMLPATLTILISFLFSNIDYFDNSRWLKLAWIGTATASTLIITIIAFLKKEDVIKIIRIKTRINIK